MKLHLGKSKHPHQPALRGESSVRQELQGAGDAGMDEVAAAIGMAISMYMQDMHDNEKTILTMQKAMKPYSPWSSKIYGLREMPLYIPRARK